jgi:anti-sigma regulatory factor (Ser/Thr protein kinase)
MKVMVIDLCGDEKWEDTLEGARDFLLGIWQNMDVDEDDMEEDEITVEEHMENIAAANYEELNEYLQGVGYYMEKL